jgi:tetratricopeptide (TPR) repeat protein
VLAQLSKTVLAFAATGVFTLSAWAQAQAQPAQGQQAPAAAQGQAAAPGQKNWKDRAEYDLVQEINKETDANKKLALLNSWKEKYPESEFKLERMQMYVVLYQQLGQAPNMLQAAKDLVAADPKNLFGLSSINLLTVSMANTSPEALDAGEKAANGLISNLDAIFAPDKKPANVDDAAWKKERTNSEALAHTTLGWAAMQRKNFEQAEQEFTKVLQIKPANAQVSYWLGTSVLAQKKPEKQAPALFHFARAVSVEGQPPDALPDAAKKQISAYLEKIYSTYHGDKTGLPELLAMAKANALPPADLKIEDANTIATRKHEEFVSSNPQLAVWMGLKQALTADNGEQYFESTLKGAAVPKLKAKVISQKPERRPTTVVVGIEKPDQPEATLKFESALSGPAEPGTEIEFEGVPSEFTKSPFNVTFDVDKDKLSGWPKAAAPPAKKAAPRRKK